MNDKLTNNQKKFFEELKQYIGKPLHFYGSIHRMDYFPGKSDIDIDIFTENEDSTITSLSSFLKIPKYKFRKTVYKVDDMHIVYGHKAKYEDKTKDINIELSVYNTSDQNTIVKEHDRCKILPIHLAILLYIIKFFFYKLPFISKEIYKQLKQWIMNGNEWKFLELDT